MKFFLYGCLIIGLNSLPKFSFCQTAITDSTTITLDNDTPEWIWVESSADGNDKFYMRSTYVSKDGNQIKIWIECKSKVATINKKLYRNIVNKQLLIFNCNNKKYSIVSLINYSSTGAVINKDDFSKYLTFDDVVPDSVIEGVLEKVCETFNN